MSKKKKVYSSEHWRNIINLSKHKKRSRLERERISELIHQYEPAMDLMGKKSGELNTILYRLRKGG